MRAKGLARRDSRDLDAQSLRSAGRGGGPRWDGGAGAGQESNVEVRESSALPPRDERQELALRRDAGRGDDRWPIVGAAGESVAERQHGVIAVAYRVTSSALDYRRTRIASI